MSNRILKVTGYTNHEEAIEGAKERQMSLCQQQDFDILAEKTADYNPQKYKKPEPWELPINLPPRLTGEESKRIWDSIKEWEYKPKYEARQDALRDKERIVIWMRGGCTIINVMPIEIEGEFGGGISVE